MTKDETVDLLSTLAAYDKRTVGETDTMIWEEAARTAGWTFPAAMRAVLEHIAFDTAYLTPAHVTARIAAARARARARWNPPPPPRALADDPAAEIAWRRRACALYVERGVQAWAEGYPLDEVPMVLDDPEPVVALAGSAAAERRRAKVTALVAGLAERKAIPAAPDPELERAQREHAAANMWAAIDACTACDPGGMLAGDVRCAHEGLRLPDLDDPAAGR